METSYCLHHIALNNIPRRGILFKARHYLSTVTLRTIYYALVYQYLYYGNIIWANTYPTSLEPIVKRSKKKIVSIITFSDFRSHAKPLFSKLAVLPLEDINNLATAVFTYKFFNNTVLPNTFNKFFQLNKDLHEYNTRRSRKIHLKHGRTNYKKYTTRNKGSHIWNKLPTEILQ